MERPDDLPEWAWKKAIMALNGGSEGDAAQKAEWIARAIVQAADEEREACVERFEAEARTWFPADHVTLPAILRYGAAAIRKRG